MLETREFCFFSRERYFIKAIENFFSVFAYPDINTRGAGRIFDSYANPRPSLDSFANPGRSLDSFANPRLRLGFA